MSAHTVLLQLAFAFLLTSAATAQAPTFRDVVGRDFGDRITLHHEMVEYLNAVAESSPRVRVEVQGQSWEGREFLLAIVTSPENHARLDEIRMNSLRLDDPRVTPVAQAQSIIASHPVVQWFGGSIHGFELSGAEGALKLLEHLSTRTDPATLEALDNVVVLIDPMLNPDGRDAWAHKNHENVGRVPSPEPEDWANDITGWEGTKFRTGHYYFDNNRDWFAQTQPVTRIRVATWRAWRPQVVTDMHEMGVDNEFFFYPGAEPVTPHVQGFAWTWIGRFADAYAAAFDSAGIEYMTREGFDYFYPGYTDGYASHLGSVGMLYEQGNSRGFMIRRSDRTVRTLADGAQNQYTAAWTAVRYAATQRQTLLREYYDGLASVIAEGQTGTRRFLIASDGDQTHRRSLTEMLRLGGVEVGQLTNTVTLANVSNREGHGVGQRQFAAGTYVVEMAQPRGRLARALLDPETPIPESFLTEARERVDRGQSDEIYDVSAWSLPLLFDMAVYSTTDGRELPVTALTELAPVAANGNIANATYAYLLDGNNAASVAALYRLLQQGFVAGMTLKDTRIRGEDVPSGTVVVRVQPNSEDVHSAVRDVVAKFGIVVRPMTSGYGDEGQISLGSADVVSVRKPSVAILAEEPVQAYSFGWAWYVLDRQYEIATTPLRARSVANTRLESFDVIVIPAASSSGLRRVLEEGGMDRLRRWVRDGGTLVTIGSATDFVMDSSALNVIQLRSWYDTDDGEDAQRLGVPGAILRGAIEPAYWLAAGMGDTEIPLLVESSRVYLAPKGAPSSARRVVVRYAPADSLALSGHLWPESVERLGGGVFLYEERVGRGRVIAFAEDPNFRGYWRGVDRLFLNAVIVGPSAP